MNWAETTFLAGCISASSFDLPWQAIILSKASFACCTNRSVVFKFPSITSTFPHPVFEHLCPAYIYIYSVMHRSRFVNIVVICYIITCLCVHMFSYKAFKYKGVNSNNVSSEAIAVTDLDTIIYT